MHSEAPELEFFLAPGGVEAPAAGGRRTRKKMPQPSSAWLKPCP